MSTRITQSGIPFMFAHEVTRRFIQPKKGEQVLIVVDSESDADFAHAFAAATYEYDAEPSIVIVPPTFLEGADRRFPKVVLKALEAADVYIPLVATTYLAIHDMEIAALLWDRTRPKNLRAFIPGGRYGSELYGERLKPTLEMLRTHDYKKVHEWGARYCKYLNNGKKIRVTSAAGTDVTASLEGMSGVFHNHAAFALEPGELGLIPDGETGGGPREFTAEGVIAIDGAITYVAPKPVLSQPVMVTVKAGRVTAIKGGEEADRLKALLDSNENGNVLAEIALGTNPYLRGVGQINLDKRVLGTIHVAFGENKMQIYPHGTVWSPIHVDGVLLKPNCWVDGVQLIQDGVPVVP